MKLDIKFTEMLNFKRQAHEHYYIWQIALIFINLGALTGRQAAQLSLILQRAVSRNLHIWVKRVAVNTKFIDMKYVVSIILQLEDMRHI